VKDHRDQSIPIEVQTMSDLRGKNGSEFIVKLLNWRIAKERRLYRLYLEYEFNRQGLPKLGLLANYVAVR
jgi:hypothetical protein